METRIYINAEAVDLKDKAKAPFTFEVSDLGELKDKFANYSKSITLLMNGNNSRILNIPSEPTCEEKTVYTRSDCYVYQDGVLIIPKAYFIIRTVTDTEIVGNIFFGNYGFFNSIKDLKINDLASLEDLNHIRQPSVIMAYKQPIGDFVYPDMEWGDFLQDVGDEVWLDYLYPCVKLPYLIDNIISAAGYKKGNVFDFGGSYDTAVIPVASKSAHLGGDNFVQAFETDSQTIVVPASTAELVDLDPPSYDPTSQFVLTSWVSQLNVGSYQAKHTGKLYIELKITFSGVGAGYNAVSLNVSPDINHLNYEGYLHETIVNGQVTIQNKDVDFVEIAVDDYLTFQINTTSGCTYTVDSLKIWFAGNTFYKFEFPIKGNMPDMLQKDLIKSMAYLYGLILQTDEINKKIYAFNFDTLYDNIDSAEDWSDLLDTTHRVGFSYSDSKFAQRNYFKYSSLTEEENVNTAELGEATIKSNTYNEFGDSYINIEDDSLDPQKDMVTLPFYPAYNIRRIQDTEMAWLKTKNLENDLQPRILELFYIEFEDPTTYKDTYGYSYTPTHGSPMYLYQWAIFKSDNLGVYGGLSFGNMINKYYTGYKRIVSEYLKVTAYFKLSPVQIEKLDFSIPVYIEKFNAYFYISKIIDYVGEHSTKVELIRLSIGRVDPASQGDIP